MKKGFTLIEIIMVLSIILLISIFSGLNMKGFLYTKNRIKTKEFLNTVEDTIVFGRNYCINNKVSGRVIILENKESNEIIFEIGNGAVRNIKYEKIIEIDITNKVYPLSTIIPIDIHGNITPITLFLKDKNKEKYKLSITPIVFEINILKE